jgi:hypothetical protein
MLTPNKMTVIATTTSVSHEYALSGGESVPSTASIPVSTDFVFVSFRKEYES